jgi:hypothetical protein
VEVLQYSSLLEYWRNSCGISSLLEHIVPVTFVPCLNSSSASATDVEELSTAASLQKPK